MRQDKMEIKKMRTVVFFGCLLLLFCLSTLAPALAEEVRQPDLAITAVTPFHFWSEKYDLPAGDPWFNLTNYVKVTVANNGENKTNRSFVVTLCANDDEIGSERVEELLNPEESTDVRFEWVPKGEEEDPLSWTDTAEGAICTYTDTSVEYTLKAKVVADEDGEVLAENETKQKVVWNGYSADEPLENLVHGEVEGGIIYSTGDGEYRSYEDGDSGTDDTYYDINYDLEIPGTGTGSTKLARLYIYYTWAKPSYKAPKMSVRLETPSGNSYDLKMERSYNDIKGDLGGDRYAWGTYAYDIKEYVKESGKYRVSVKNLNYEGSDSEFADKYSFAPPAILVVYEDTAAPKREYWINEGADLLMSKGGDEESPRPCGFLSLEECKNTATFLGDVDLSEVKEAVLGVVSAWGGNPVDVWHSYLYFNDEELGMDVYDGYSGSCSKEMGGVLMYVGSDYAQLGIELTDVKDYLESENNEVIQGDDGDNMMPTNAFLLITCENGDDNEPTPPNITAWNPIESVVNSTEDELRTFDISVNQTVEISWQLNGTQVQTNESVTEAEVATYTNTSAVAGIWNVSAVATNTETGLSARHTWLWNVTPVLNATPTPTPNPSPTPTANLTPTSTPSSATPTPLTPSLTPPTPTPTSVPKVTPTPALTPTPTTTPVPGFELPITLCGVLLAAAVVRVRQARKKKK